ncbi:MAG: hypothetical protein HGA31_06510 [Candidatus Moranbacteria bacterium]|nr:hypothetical protein [Candidatus Moranbacteria bacterium]
MKRTLHTIGSVVLLVMFGAGVFFGCVLSAAQSGILSLLIGFFAVIVSLDIDDDSKQLGGRAALFLGGVDILILWITYLFSHVTMPDVLVPVIDGLTRLFPG